MIRDDFRQLPLRMRLGCSKRRAGRTIRPWTTIAPRSEERGGSGEKPDHDDAPPPVVGSHGTPDSVRF